jgi:hypothetical protein
VAGGGGERRRKQWKQFEQQKVIKGKEVKRERMSGKKWFL